jgi:hypothetical protein
MTRQRRHTQKNGDDPANKYSHETAMQHDGAKPLAGQNAGMKPQVTTDFSTGLEGRTEMPLMRRYNR